MKIAYNEKLEAIAAKYPGTPGGTFAVIYSPTAVNFYSFATDAFR